MFGSDELTQKEIWGLYSLAYPFVRNPSSNSYQSVDLTSTPQSKTKSNSDHDGVSPSPYHHFATDSKKKKLGLAALSILIFYEVCGGPFGIEDIVRAGGPFYALVGFSLLLVWAVPEALITAELSTAMPEASGSVGKRH